MWITTNCGKFLKIWESQTSLLPPLFLLGPKLGEPFLLNLDGSSSLFPPSVRCQKLSFWTSKHVMHTFCCVKEIRCKKTILDGRLLPLFPIRQIGLKFLLPKLLPFPFICWGKKSRNQEEDGGFAWVKWKSLSFLLPVFYLTYSKPIWNQAPFLS